jgi:ribosomal protein S12 methylthiotransferase accessory factor
METSAVRFGDSLIGPESAGLRRQLSELAVGLDEPLVVDSLLALHRQILDGNLPPTGPLSYLLLDVQHLFLFEEPAPQEGTVRIDSAVRALIDGYPTQPFDDLDRHFAKRPFQLFLPEESLALLPYLWARRRAGSLTAISLTTGEIETSEVLPHPTSPHSTSPVSRLAEQERLDTDVSLRLRSPRDLERFVSRAAGVVREQSTIWGFMSLPVATAATMWGRGQHRELCFGKGIEEGHARTIARCEALERYQIAQHRSDEELIYGTFDDLAEQNPIDPRELFFGRCPLYPDDLLPIYNADLPIYWTRARAPSGGEALVPAQEIWFSAQELPGEHPSIAQTTSGCALGSCFEEAALFALLEAVERDSYLTAWYLRRPCRQIDPDSVASERFQILRRRWELEFSDYSLHLFDVTNDTAVPAIAAFGVRRRGSGPKTFLGVAARLSPERACLTALEDIASFSRVMTEKRLRRSLHLLANPEEISSPADHGSVYALEEPFERLSFLDFDSPVRIEVGDLWCRVLISKAERYELRTVLDTLECHLATCGVRIFFKDITHPAVAEQGLRCVKAIPPGLYPLWFGARQRRFGETPRLRRLAKEWGGSSQGGPETYNLEVHPFT